MSLYRYDRKDARHAGDSKCKRQLLVGKGREGEGKDQKCRKE